MGSKQEIKSKTFKIYCVLLVLAIILIIFGIFLMRHASNISEYEQRQNYRWRIVALTENDTPANFKQFIINYHFSEEEGTISFIPDEYVKQIMIFFPGTLKENVTLEIMGNDNHWQPFEAIFPEHKQEDKKTTIIFEKNNTEKWIQVKFKMDLSPNAKFNIDKNSYWSNGQIYFTFGNEFECIRSDCAFDIWHLELLRDNIPYVNSLRLQIVNQSKTGDPLHIFQTSARSLNIINTKSFYISMGASLVAGAIFALFTIFIEISKYLEKNKFKSPHSKA